MKRNSQSRLYVFFFVLQILTLFGCGKFGHAPCFGEAMEKDNTKQVFFQKILSSHTKEDQDKNKNNKNTSTYSIEDTTIVIDPGHQMVPDYTTEPIGPGSDKEKAKVSIGGKGIKTKIPEYQINLTIAKRVKKALTKEGYRVILTREVNEVNLSNKQRALFANEVKANLVLHIHCNSSDNRKLCGSLAMCPARRSPYCKEIYEASKQACEKILDTICGDTKMKNNGVLETDFMAGINYSKVPVCFLDIGYLSNEADERKLLDDSFLDQLAESLVKGVDSYFSEDDH